MVLALLVIQAQVEASWTSPLVWDLHVGPVVEGHKLEGEFGLINAVFATRVLLIGHGRGIPSATTKEAKFAVALAGLLRKHVLVEHEDPAVQAALAIHVAQ